MIRIGVFSVAKTWGRERIWESAQKYTRLFMEHEIKGGWRPITSLQLRGPKPDPLDPERDCYAIIGDFWKEPKELTIKDVPDSVIQKLIEKYPGKFKVS